MDNLAFRYTKDISFPRLVGTIGEREVASYLVRNLKEMGYKVVEEEFPISIIPSILIKIGFILSIIMLLIAFCIIPVHNIEATILCSLSVLFFLLYGQFWLLIARFLPNWSKGIKSRNIIASFGENSTKSPEIILMAHYDSKSQSISLATRILLMAILILFTSCFTLLCTGLIPEQSILMKITIFPILISSFILIKTRTGNESAGALDNGGSVGVLLSIAKRFSENPLNHVHLTFLFTGAEEMGLLGAIYFLKKNQGHMDKRRTYIINLDGVGIEGKLRINSKSAIFPGKEDLYRLIREAAQKEGVRLRFFPLLPGLLMDHIVFVKEGFQAVSLFCVAKKSLLIHGRGDTIEVIEPKGLNEVSQSLINQVLNFP